MTALKTTDNNNKNPLEVLKEGTEKDRDNLSDVATLCSFDIEKNPNLLIFPQNWQLGIDKSDKVFELNSDNLITGNIMGFIGYNETQLIISSRFHQKNNDYFLHYMLHKVLGINVVNLDFSTGKEDIHDFLPYLFPSYLQNALSQGLFKQYKRNQYNDANVKGVIDINRHIKMNIPFIGKIAYTTREHSHDNDITQLIRHTIEHLRTRVFGHSILTNNADTIANVSQIEYATPTYKRRDLQKVIKANMRTISHPYFTKYKDLQKLCLQILRREKTTFGEKNKVHGLLFDGAWLWEEYIATILKKKGIEHRIKGTDRLFVDGQGIIPDFIKPIENNKASFIGDAKYKRKDESNSREDYFQIITYMFRYSCSTGYLIFPYDKDNEYEKTRSINNGTGYKVVELGLKIPQKAEKFDDFCEEIERHEAILLDNLNNYS